MFHTQIVNGPSSKNQGSNLLPLDMGYEFSHSQNAIY